MPPPRSRKRYGATGTMITCGRKCCARLEEQRPPRPRRPGEERARQQRLQLGALHVERDPGPDVVDDRSHHQQRLRAGVAAPPAKHVQPGPGPKCTSARSASVPLRSSTGSAASARTPTTVWPRSPFPRRSWSAPPAARPRPWPRRAGRPASACPARASHRANPATGSFASTTSGAITTSVSPGDRTPTSPAAAVGEHPHRRARFRADQAEVAPGASGSLRRWRS